jgi:hypothetical protein
MANGKSQIANPKQWPCLLLICYLPFAICYLPGCASRPPVPAELQIAPGAYPQAFEAAKSSLTERGFELDRVDARAGVITSAPKHTAGLATPWDREQATLEHEFEDLMNQQHRTVRITFDRVAATTADDAGVERDLREEPGPVLARVEVALTRVHVPGWRIETTSVPASRRWRDPDLLQRGIGGRYEVPFTLDPHLAADLAASIRKKQPEVTVVPTEVQPPRPVERPSLRPHQARTRAGYWD